MVIYDLHLMIEFLGFDNYFPACENVLVGYNVTAFRNSANIRERLLRFFEGNCFFCEAYKHIARFTDLCNHLLTCCYLLGETPD